MRLNRILAAAIAAFSVTSGAALAKPKPAKQPSQAAISYAQQAAAMISAYRAQHGLGPVVLDARLTRAASYQAAANARAGNVSHDAGGSFDSRMIAAGFGRGGIAENLAAGLPTFEQTFALWQASPGHNSNLLHPNIRRIGIAHADPSGSSYRFWALELAR